MFKKPNRFLLLHPSWTGSEVWAAHSPQPPGAGGECVLERGTERYGAWNCLLQQVPKYPTGIGPEHMWEGWAGGLGSGGPARATCVGHLSARCSLEAAGDFRSWAVLAQDTFLLIMSLGTVGWQAAGCGEQPECGLGIGLGVCRLAGGDPRDPVCIICSWANAFGSWECGNWMHFVP